MNIGSILSDIWGQVTEMVESIRESVAEAKHSFCQNTKLCDPTHPPSEYSENFTKKLVKSIGNSPWESELKSLERFRSQGRRFKRLSPEQVQKVFRPEQLRQLREHLKTR